MARALISGTGLIGASIGLGLGDAGWEVLGWDPDPGRLSTAVAVGAVALLRKIDFDQALGGRFNQGALPGERRRFRRKRMRGRGAVARYVGLRNGAFFDRPDRFAGHTTKYVTETLFAHLGDGFDLLAIDRDVDEIGAAWKIVIP